MTAQVLGGSSRVTADQPLIRSLLSRVVLGMLRVTVERRECTARWLQDGPTIVTANHVSLVDGIMIAMASPVPLVFAVETEYSVHSPIARRGLALLSLLGYGWVIPLDSSCPLGMRRLLDALRRGRSVMLFPEGRISPNGTRLPEQPGYRWLRRRSNAHVVELAIDGAHRSRLFGKSGTAWWPRIHLTF